MLLWDCFQPVLVRGLETRLSEGQQLLTLPPFLRPTALCSCGHTSLPIVPVFMLSSSLSSFRSSSASLTMFPRSSPAPLADGSVKLHSTLRSVLSLGAACIFLKQCLHLLSGASSLVYMPLICPDPVLKL